MSYYWMAFDNSTIVFRAPDGSVTAPAFSFTADTNTGIYRIGADILGVTTGGVEALRVNATQQVLIGTTTGVTGEPLRVSQASGDLIVSFIGAAATNSTRLLCRQVASESHNCHVGIDTSTGTISGFANAGFVQKGGGGAAGPLVLFQGDNSTYLTIGRAAREYLFAAANTQTTPDNVSVRFGGDGSGTDVAGGNASVRSGLGTGSASTSGSLIFLTGQVGTTGTTPQTATERMRITPQNSTNLARIAFGDFSTGQPTGAPTYDLSLGNEKDWILNIEARSTATAGRELTIGAGNSGTGTNLSGGDLVLRSGDSTGNVGSEIRFRVAIASASGTTARTNAERLVITNAGQLAHNPDAAPTATTGAAIDTKMKDTTTAADPAIGIVITADRNESTVPTGDVTFLDFATGTVGGTGAAHTITNFTGIRFANVTYGTNTTVTRDSAFRFTAAVGTHKFLRTAVDASTGGTNGALTLQKLTTNATARVAQILAYVSCDINGTLGYIPVFDSNP